LNNLFILIVLYNLRYLLLSCVTAPFFSAFHKKRLSQFRKFRKICDFPACSKLSRPGIDLGEEANHQQLCCRQLSRSWHTMLSCMLPMPRECPPMFLSGSRCDLAQGKKETYSMGSKSRIGLARSWDARACASVRLCVCASLHFICPCMFSECCVWHAAVTCA